MMLLYLLALICLLIICNIALDLSRIRQCTNLIKKISSVGEEDLGSLISERSKLFLLVGRAGVHDQKFIKEYYTDQGMHIMEHTNVATDFPYFGSNERAIKMLLDAKGFYHLMFTQHINPLYWLKMFFRIPSKIVQYIGFDPNATFSKILNVIWWVFSVLWWFITPLIENLREYLLNLLNF